MEFDLIKDNSDNNKVETDKTQKVEKKLLNAAKIMERVLNLNTYEDVARDFRFYEDPADEFRAPEGSLLPLWKFKFEAAERGMESTHLMWNPNYNDLFGVSLGLDYRQDAILVPTFQLTFLGSFSFYNNLQVGYVCIYSLKNPSYPEYICRASSGIISFDIHPSHPNMVTFVSCSVLAGYPSLSRLLWVCIMAMSRCTTSGAAPPSPASPRAPPQGSIRTWSGKSSGSQTTWTATSTSTVWRGTAGSLTGQSSRLGLGNIIIKPHYL